MNAEREKYLIASICGIHRVKFYQKVIGPFEKVDVLKSRSYSWFCFFLLVGLLEAVNIPVQLISECKFHSLPYTLNKKQSSRLEGTECCCHHAQKKQHY